MFNLYDTISVIAMLVIGCATYLLSCLISSKKEKEIRELKVRKLRLEVAKLEKEDK